MKVISNPQKRKGISLVWFALTFIIIFAVLGLMLDWANVYLVGHQLHNVADAAALAGARWVPDPNSLGPVHQSARDKAQEYANANFADKLSVNLDPDGETATEVYIDMSLPETTLYSTYLNDGDIYIGRYVDNSRLFIKNDPYPDAMLVVTRKNDDPAANPRLPLLFAPIVTTFYGGDVFSTAGIQKYAVAKIGNPYGAGLLALGNCNCPGIIFSGGGSVDDLTIFGGGSLYVNSTSLNAISVDGNISVDLERIYTVGGIDDEFYNKKNDVTETDIHQNADPEPDPYRYPDGEQPLPDHDVDAIRAMSDNGTITDANDGQSFSPGYYSGGIQLNNAEVTLAAGDYYLDSIGQPASLSMTSGLITGQGVTLHIIGDADYGININGGNLDISAPTSGTYKGIGIYQKRDPDYDCFQSCFEPWQQAFPMSEFNGNGTIDVGGVVYMPHNRLELNGSGVIILERVIADRFYISGNGEKVVNYMGKPEIAEKSYLVE